MVEAEAAAVAAAVPGHQGTVGTAQALARCSWCGLHDEERASEKGGARERGRKSEREYRRVPVGSLSAASRGTGERSVGGGRAAQGRWRWTRRRKSRRRRRRRYERIPYSEGFQAAVYGPGQRDQDQAWAERGCERSRRESSCP